MKGYDTIDDKNGTVYVPGQKPAENTSSSAKGNVDYTFLRKVLNENRYITGIGSTISVKDFSEDITFVEVSGGNVSLSLNEKLDHNRTWKIIIVALQDTTIIIPKDAYFSGGKTGEENSFFIKKNENQIITVTCSRNDSKTNYSVELSGTPDSIRDTEARLKDLIDQVNSEIIKVYDTITQSSEMAISWED